MRALAQRGRLEAEMEAELASHLDNLTADLIRAGFSPAEAARRGKRTPARSASEIEIHPRRAHL